MNFSIGKKKQANETPPAASGGEVTGMNSFVAQFFVFEGEKYLGWDCFDGRTVRVGKSHAADLVLDDDRIADIQAEFTIKGRTVTVSDCGGNGLMTVNAQPVATHTLRAFDVVKIGRYSVKIKLKPIETPSVQTVTEPVAEKPAVRQAPVKAKPVEPPMPVQSKPVVQKAPEQPKPVVQQTPAKAKPVAPVKAKPQPAPAPVSEKKDHGDLSLSLKDIMDDELDAVDLEEILELDILEEQGQSGAVTMEASLSPVMDADSTETIPLSDLECDEDIMDAEPGIPVSPSVRHSLLEEPVESMKEISWDEFTGEIPASPKVVKPEVSLKGEKTDLVLAKKVKDKKKEKAVLKVQPEAVMVREEKKEPMSNTFPPSFFRVIADEEDEEEEDMPANFSLREKLIGNDRNAGRSPMGERVLEVIRFRKDSVLDITHLKGNGDHVLVDDGAHFCRVSYTEKQGLSMLFNEPLLGVINTSQGQTFNAQKKLSAKSLISREKTYASMLPVKGELLLSDGFYDYVLRQSFISESPAVHIPKVNEHLPAHQRALKSTVFKYASRAVIFHLILIVILSYSITMPTKEEFKDPETYFVMVETENIHKPVKPKPKPRPPAPKPMKVEKEVKELPKPAVLAAKNDTKKVEKPKSVEPPKAGGGHEGNVVNRNVNEVGLLASLGINKGIGIKPNEALASVTNMDAVTTTHASEANFKLGGLVGDLGDSKINITSGAVIDNKGAADVLRSAGIGGKGSVAALENGNTGNRAVTGSVSAPLTKKAVFKGGGISREAVAKVINDHLEEINYCYETALIGDPTLMGKIEFEWTILLDGSVGEVKIKTSSVRSNEIHACIKAAIRTWTFPEPKGQAVVVSYPFVFDVSGF